MRPPRLVPAAPALDGRPAQRWWRGRRRWHARKSCGRRPAVSNGPIERGRHDAPGVCSFKTFRPASAHWSGIPTPSRHRAGGVLVHVDNRPAPAASRLLHLNPGDVATADVQSHAVDTTTGNDCGRRGHVSRYRFHNSVAHTLPVSLPICSATISMSVSPAGWHRSAAVACNRKWCSKLLWPQCSSSVLRLRRRGCCRGIEPRPDRR